MEHEVSSLSIDSIAKQLQIPQINPCRKYWLVRTSSGVHYEDFTVNGYIAIGWDQISIPMMKENSAEAIKKIISIVKKSEPGNAYDEDDDEEIEDPNEKNLSERESSNVTGIYHKIVRFLNEFSVGDIVVIPSRNSTLLSFGIIASEAYEDTSYVERYLAENPDTEIIPCPYNKRRRVNWIKSVPRNNADIYLLKALSSHHAISSIDDSAQYINRTLHDLYAINNEVHAVFRAGHPNGVSFRELKDFVDSLSGIFENISEETGLEYDPDGISVKLNIHSPGLIEIITAYAIPGVILIGGIFAVGHYRHGGKTHFKMKLGEVVDIDVSSESKGTLDYKAERSLEQFDKIAQRLDVKLPAEDLVVKPEEPMDE